ncbi:MAG: DnaD domain-containing protein [Streptococcaceae bacterium]|jgi:DNA replication protein|nr:DnaD domain-containing protein [Streptococcaceae bacterium]
MSYYEEFLSGHLVLPSAILKNFTQIFDNSEDFLVWLFLLEDKETAPSQIAECLGRTLTQVNASIQGMQKAGLLKVSFIEQDGQSDMMFDVAPTFQKIDALSLSANEDKSAQVSENKLQTIAKAFEAEMGMISPMQLEELRLWLVDDKFEADLILAALREAVLNRKVSLNYIRAILRRWRADGISSARDIEEQREIRESSQGNSAPKTYSGKAFSIPTEGF